MANWTEASAVAGSADLGRTVSVLQGQPLEEVLPRLGLGPFAWSARGDVVAWSPGARALLRLTPDAPLPPSLRAYKRLMTPEAVEARDSLFAPAALTDGSRHEGVPYSIICEFRGTDDDSATFRLREAGRWWPDTDGYPARIEACLFLAEDAEAGPTLSGNEVNATTGLLRRDALFLRLRELLERLLQDRQGSAAFLVIAINDLADINSSFGYEVGDHIIATVAQRIARRMRHADVIGHMSGHKFGVILHNCTESSLEIAAERFRSAVDDELVVTPAAEIQVSISIGAVIVPRNARDAEAAAMRAEEALGDARLTVDNKLAIFHHSPERDQVRRRNLEMAEEIVQGLAEDRFLLAYQPVVDSTSRQVVSYEALTRLVTRDGRIISADPLVVTAERLGLVRRIDQQALRLVLADLKANRQLKLGVNVSPETVTDPAWIGHLVDHVSVDRDIARRLTVEITETAAFRNPEEVCRMSETLRDIGCRVAIDDFGAGYTSMKALRELEIDVIKIDGTFIRDITINPDSVVFVRVLVEIARHLGVRTVAEWVQDETSARRLADIGVNMLQGRHVGEPKLRLMPLSEPILARYPVLRSEQETDGYSVAAGQLAGPLSVEELSPSGPITSREPADPAVVAWPRAAS